MNRAGLSSLRGPLKSSELWPAGGLQHKSRKEAAAVEAQVGRGRLGANSLHQGARGHRDALLTAWLGRAAQEPHWAPVPLRCLCRNPFQRPPCC